MEKKLKSAFVKNELNYQLIEYEEVLSFDSDESNGKTIGICIFEAFSFEGYVYTYDVMKVRKRYGVQCLNGKGGYYHQLPSNNEFGYYGWSYSNKEKAIER
jgi:hypothetical protein